MPVSHSILIDPDLQQRLLKIARMSIKFGLQNNKRWLPAQQDYPDSLWMQGASFVTLTKDEALRGCIGSIQAYQPLLLDVAQHAYDAAFRDNRFSPLVEEEYGKLAVHVSILSEPEPMAPGLSEEQLLSALTPSRDGLILELGNRRAVFLPQVWRQLPDPRQFLLQLKLKGGWMPDSWPDNMQASTFQVQEFGDSSAAQQAANEV